MNDEVIEEGAEQSVEKAQFVLENRGHAEWYLRKLANLEREEEGIKLQAEAMLRRVRAEKDKHTARYESQFWNVTREELAKQTGKYKSVLYFNGVAQFTAVSPRLVVEDEAAAIQTARLSVPKAIIVVPESVKLDKKALLDHAKAHFEATGEILDGLNRTEAGERLSITFPKPGTTSDNEE